MRKIITILAILALVLGLIAGVSFFLLKKNQPSVREAELQKLEAQSAPITTTIEERGGELRELEKGSQKPTASVEARTNGLKPFLE